MLNQYSIVGRLLKGALKYIKMAAINFLPETDLAPSDPSELPCLFVGSVEHIKAAGYNGAAKFLGNKVDEKVTRYVNWQRLKEL